MGCHLKYVEASAGIKQNLPGAMERPPLTVSSEVLLFLSAATTFAMSWFPSYLGCTWKQFVLGSSCSLWRFCLHLMLVHFPVEYV